MKYIGNYKDQIPKDSSNNASLPAGFEKRQNASIKLVEYDPGKILYTHTDQFLSQLNNPIKYIMFLNDWQIGHIFTYNDQMLADYKEGDVFQFNSDTSIVYSQANIAYEAFSVLEITIADRVV